MLTRLWLIPLLPLAGFVINGLLGTRLSKRVVGLVACGAVLLAFLASATAVWQLTDGPGLAGLAAAAPAGVEVDVDARRVEVSLWEWLPAGLARDRDGRLFDLTVDWGYQLDPLAAVLLLVVTGVGFLIHVYSIGYMDHEPGFARFFSYLNLFMAMMLTLVLGSSLPVMFVGWEGVGLCSYLLIGFYTDRPFDERSGLTCADAGRKAFIVNRIGDFGFMLGMLLVLVTFGTLDLSTLTERAGTMGSALPAGLVTAIALLLFVGATGKSAQIPLYVWLPDAMAGPTPVSALIHAATMVTAGVYMVCRTSALWVHTPEAMFVVAGIGASTALLAAIIGTSQHDIKKILAYSTVSQLGYMFLAAGVGAFSAAMFHLMTHAFFKALLFLGAGSVIHGMGGEQDVRRMGGLRGLMPITWRVMLIATLAIAGVPGLAGFFSKDEILWRAFGAVDGPGYSGHPMLWVVGAGVAGLTAFYMFRMLFLVFLGEGRMDHDTRHHVHESPRLMWVPLAVLAALSITGGWVGIPHALGGGNRIEAWLAPSLPGHEAPVGGHDAAATAGHGEVAAGSEAAVAGEHGAPAMEYILMALSVLIAACGVGLAWIFYVRKPGTADRLAAAVAPLHRLVENKFYVDEIYAATVLAAFYGLCHLSSWFDRRIVDGTVNLTRHVTIVVSHISSAFDRWVIDMAVNGLGALARLGFRGARRMQTGLVQSYASLMVFGLFLLVGLYLVFTGP